MQNAECEMLDVCCVMVFVRDVEDAVPYNKYLFWQMMPYRRMIF